MGLEFQLVLTENCNLACKYCYIDQKNNNMTIETFNAHYKMLPSIMDFYNEKTYNAALFGGEPLLNWKLIEYIIPIFKKDPKCNHIVLISNGLLLKDDYKREWIKKNNIGISLSFDGLWNKTNRPLKNGSSSFDEYLKEPLKSFFNKNGGCKVMVSPQSVPTLVENFKWFVEEYGINFPDFTIVRDDIWTNEDVKLFEEKMIELTDVIINYFKDGKVAIVGLLKLYILDLLFGESYGKRPFGCFAGCHGAGFMPNGKVYPCARFGSNDKYPIANSITNELLPSINVMNNPLITNPQTFEKCQSCTLYKYCNAGCTYQQMKVVNSVIVASEPIDNICKLLHICYKQSIRIVNELKENELFIGLIKNSIKNVG